MRLDGDHRRIAVRGAALLLLAAVLAGCGSAGSRPGGGAAISPHSAAPSSGPPPAESPVWPDSVQMLTPATGWALLWTSNPSGSAALQVATTSDGGRTWSTVTPLAAGSSLVNSQTLLEAAGGGQAWLAAAGGKSQTTRVFRTSDSGRTWQESAAIAGAQPVAIDFANPANGWLLESLGAALGQNPVQLLRSTDGGQHWTLAARSAMGSHAAVGGMPAGCDKSGMSFASDATSGWITSFCNSLSGAVLHSGDGGQNWSTTRLPISPRVCLTGGCEVPAPQFAGNTTFLQIDAYPGAPYLLESADAGATWLVRQLPAGAGPYPRTQWFSPSDGISVAAGSQESVGRDSYLTSDAGRTWTPVPLARPFGTAGASFDFVSQTTGFAWIPGSSPGGGTPAMYRTSNSGRSWTSFRPSRAN